MDITMAVYDMLTPDYIAMKIASIQNGITQWQMLFYIALGIFILCVVLAIVGYYLKNNSVKWSDLGDTLNIIGCIGIMITLVVGIFAACKWAVSAQDLIAWQNDPETTLAKIITKAL